MLRLLEAGGRDARDFLHRVTAGEVQKLEPGFGRAGLLCDGQSRMIATFDLLCLGPERFLLAAPEPCFTALANGLQKLHFAEDFVLKPLATSIAAVADRGAPRPPLFPIHAEGEGWGWHSPVPGFSYATGDVSPVAWEFARIGALVPWPGLDWDSATPALEAGMLPWISRDKGCYPGQEVVERSLNVGHPARVLVAVESAAELKPGPLPLAEGKSGTVTSVASSGGVFRAFVRVPWAARATPPPGCRFLSPAFHA